MAWNGDGTAAATATGADALRTIEDAVARHGGWVEPLRREIARVIVGQQQLVDRLLIALLSGGHILLEGVPGLAKTLALRTLAQTIEADFHRIQFTPDMLPADIMGTEIYEQKTGEFRIKRGPVFTNFVLADEINRAPAKVQSALLEAMQERQVTIGDETLKLPEPFLVMATQNPIEQEGTYPLPEAQTDRFMLKTVVEYPSLEEERRIIDVASLSEPPAPVRRVVDTETIGRARDVVRTIHIDDRLKDYIVRLVYATRQPARFGLEELEGLIRFGGSPRATLSLVSGARASAFLDGRGFVVPDDIKRVAPDVLRHRIGVTYEAEAEGVRSEDVVRTVLERVAIG
ncbi:MAG: MoxR family ATPase [Planctomycetota bacterium]|nr:MAG: MoxR family ATPase [Planctomycetota bacterium]